MIVNVAMNDAEWSQLHAACAGAPAHRYLRDVALALPALNGSHRDALLRRLQSEPSSKVTAEVGVPLSAAQGTRLRRWCGSKLSPADALRLALSGDPALPPAPRGSAASRTATPEESKRVGGTISRRSGPPAWIVDGRIASAQEEQSLALRCAASITAALAGIDDELVFMADLADFPALFLRVEEMSPSRLEVVFGATPVPADGDDGIEVEDDDVDGDDCLPRLHLSFPGIEDPAATLQMIAAVLPQEGTLIGRWTPVPEDEGGRPCAHLAARWVLHVVLLTRDA